MSDQTPTRGHTTVDPAETVQRSSEVQPGTAGEPGSPCFEAVSQPGAEALPGAPAAGVLDSVSDAIYEKFPAASPAAAKIEDAADYLRSHSLRDTGADLLECIRNHPESSLITSFVAGLLAGYFLRRALRNQA